MTYGPKSYNVDINQLGASQYPRFSIDQRLPYKDGLVEDVIVNEDHPQYSAANGTNIGMVRVRLIPEDRGVQSEQLNWAMPLETSIRQYPLKNELVMVFYSLGRLFYTKRINVNNKITENSWPGLAQSFSPTINEVNRVENLKLASEGGPTYTPWNREQAFTLGNEFAENPSAKMARANEGDTIIQGRFGHIIRMGSSLFSNPITTRPEPNLLITVGQEYDRVVSTQKESPFALVSEDINLDKNCIWIVTDEEVKLEPATINSISHLRSAESSDANKYTGAQIFINSDRVILNSKLNEISLFSKKEINLSAVESITVDSAKAVMITAVNDVTITTQEDILFTGKTVSIIAPDDISISTNKNFVISAKEIFIGSDGDRTQPIVLGVELAKWLREMLTILIDDPAPVLTSTGPAKFNPALLIQLQMLNQKLGFPEKRAVFNSTSIFTSK